ncbi:hypothetical protein HPB48_009387 [Haemaphysalis longicornis]|uniref:Uncharacterized protein n=1 Tax=Haemaphysalis longicornis TaxID=44386 RepID=A0A9J6GYY4_HAELO|nr:hypothetical protein HPB48_009387 [Haemaphysalis longicornis]
MATGVSYTRKAPSARITGRTFIPYRRKGWRTQNAYVQLKQLQIGGKTFGVAAYLAAQENTCKAVVRELGLLHTDEDLEKMFVNERNPTILDTRRITNSKTVVLLFNGMKEPRYVLIGKCLT